jgi:hypothetical protein
MQTNVLIGNMKRSQAVWRKDFGIAVYRELAVGQTGEVLQDMTDHQRPADGLIWAGWLAMGAALGGAAYALCRYSTLFGPEIEVIDQPAIALATGITIAGALFLLILPLVKATLGAAPSTQKKVLAFIVLCGLLLRLALINSTPAFEDDWNRYLWDGAVTAHGFNPYEASPDDAQGEPYHYTLQPLARASGVVIERVNHSHLRTVYPPVAQAFFALAYAIEPFSLLAWRAVLLGSEVLTLVLLMALLVAAGRSPLWSALYWLNPVAVKEIMNSAHMEGIVMPFVLGALLLAVRGRTMLSAGVLVLAAGAKIWPLILAPLILRPYWTEPRRLAGAALLIAALMALWLAPISTGGFDSNSGFVAFAQYWRTNSAHFPILESLVRFVLPENLSAGTTATLIAKAALAVVAAGIALWVAWRPLEGGEDLLARAAVTVGALFILSPVQFPWYGLWMLPLLAFLPSLGLLAAVALTPIYYASFYFMAHDQHETFRSAVVWLIWIPVWSILIFEIASWRTSSTSSRAHA